MNLQMFCTAKKTADQVKRQPTELKTIFVHYVPDRELNIKYSRIGILKM